MGVSQVLDGGRWYAGPPSQVVWQPGALASGATFLARYVVQLSGTSALGEQVGAAILAEEIVATAPGPPMAEQGMVFGGVDLPGAIEMTPSGTEYSFDTPTPTRTPTRTPSPTSTPTRTMTPTRTPTPSLTAPDTRAPDVLIYNQGANVTWFDEDSMGYSTRSNALFWTNVMQVWLPVVMRSVR
ncbi:MAG: hypothetical protein CVU38_19395 [Chloroflexi bacterium HGW-Chloroflexi-1]|nr:MAG: hypothetical protein CVU38_19395 [Chloroflexi bacterium HGW-Chloroflexi-1]